MMAVLGYTARFISSNEVDCTAVLSLDHLDAIRGAELDKIASLFPAGARILEIGAGTGKQALELQRRGFEVTAVEIADSNYAAHRVFPIKDYDGQTIPLADASVDVVFSSNVLEHVADLSRMHAEIRRVLAPGGDSARVVSRRRWAAGPLPTHTKRASELSRAKLAAACSKLA